MADDSHSNDPQHRHGDHGERVEHEGRVEHEEHRADRPHADRDGNRYADHSSDRYTDSGELASTIRRVSWGAILAGTAVAVVMQLVFNLLGLGIGFSALDPAQEPNPFSGIGIGTIIFLVITVLLALFIGGWVAGRLAGLPKRFDGALHGFITWAAATLLTFWLLTTAIGSVISGVTGLVGQGLSAAGQGVAAAVPEQAIQRQFQDLTLQQVRREARQLLRQGTLQNDATGAVDTLQAEAQDAAQNPTAVQQDLDRALSNLAEQGREADVQNVASILAARTDMSQQEARRTARQYQQRFQSLQQRASGALDSLGQQAQQTGGNVADVASTIGWVGFFAMLVGALAAAAGGALGAPHDLPASPAVRRE